MLIFLYMLLVQALTHVVLLSEGEQISLNIDSQAKVEVENSCVDNIEIYRISIEKMMQQLTIDDFVKFLAFPTNPTIIFGLQKQGRLILYQVIDSGEFQIQQDLNLNPGELPDFQCSDMTQASELVYLAVCVKKQEFYIVKIQCNEYVVCESILIDEEKQSQGCTDAKITSESWRMQDPKYFSIYCSSLSNGSQSHIYIIDGKANSRMHQLHIPLNFVQKVSFFDENTLMILDQQFGLFIVQFFVTDTVTFNILLQQRFLIYEVYYQMSYSIEQTSIRFPPKGIVQNDIQFSLVIVSNLYLYELVLPSKSEDFRNNLLPISDKIFLKVNQGEEIQHAVLSYDELFYFLCLSGMKENRCIRYRRHSLITESRELLSNSLKKPVMLSYIVAYSTTPGQTNIIISQGDRLTLISNQDEKLIVQVKQAMKCKIIVDSEQYDLWISPVNVAEVYILQNSIEKQFQTPTQRINIQNIVRGPAPYLMISPRDQNVDVGLANGYEFPMPDEIYEKYFAMARYRKLFNDNGFRITFVQNRKIDIIIEYMMPTEESQFSIETFSAECTYQAIIRQIEGVSPYYLIFYQYVNEYSIIKFTDGFQFTCETKPLPIEEDHEIIIDLDFYNVFFNTDSGIYYINLEEDVLYQIDVQRRYRQLSFKYLKYNIIVGSWEGNLEILELDKPYRGHVFKSQMSNILIDVGTHDFRFLIFETNRILIIDDDIKVYAIENLLVDQLSLSCVLPLMGFQIIKATIVLNGHILIVPLVGDTLAFVYDLKLTGAEQLINVEDWHEFPSVAIDSYLNQNEFNFCFEIHDASIRCVFRSFIYIDWLQDRSSEFTLDITAFSRFSPTHRQAIVMKGQFSYQDTVIQKKKGANKLEIYKSDGQSPLNLTDYFTGPIFEYQLQDDTVTVTPFVKLEKSVPINHNVDKVYGIFVNKDYLIILAETAISVIKIAEIQYTTGYQDVQITYKEINNKLKSYNQPSVEFCQLAFINPLSITTLQRINILAIVCVTEVLKINYLYFTILNGNRPIKEQFIENIFFIPLDIDDYIQQAQGSMKLQAIEMINYPIHLIKYKFGTISVTIKENQKFESNSKDHVITVFVGLVDQQEGPLIKGDILCEIGAQTFSQNNLIVNNLQVSCLTGCTIENDIIDSEVELVFNDLFDFNFYLVRIHVEYHIKTQKSSYKILEKTRVSLAQEQFQFAYIDTRVSKVKEGNYLLNVTTDTVSFDMTYEKGKTKVEQVFKQYTNCLSPSGSLTASYKQFFAITCRKASELEKDQTQYVKVFIRENQTPGTSVVEGIRIEGQVLLLDIDKSSASEDIQLLILEQQESKFQLRQFTLQSKFILSSNDKTPNKEFKVGICAKNIAQTQCTDLVISNIGYGDYKFNEWLLFVLFIFVPCMLSVICIICGITSYKKEKLKRIAAFGDSLEKQINSTQVNLSNTNNNTFSLRKGSSAMDIFH